MSLDEEIAILQFGQGVRADVDLLVQFAGLDNEARHLRLMELGFLVGQSKLTEADMKQALATSSLGVGYSPCVGLKLHRLSISRPGNEPEADYKFMLHLFKAVYQRRVASQPQNPANWWYWDLSQSGIEQRIQLVYQELVNDLYNDPGFRSEFASLAKLYHDAKSKRVRSPELPVQVNQYHFDFITYDELRTESIKLLADKMRQAIMVLIHSLEKALLKKYQLEPAQTGRLIFAVIERHMRETYDTDLFGQP
ncbi:DUF5958 family protein [uncultured Fibrella sp.]|uniref:DUF5958 family protein n=1 Tax=uncultured Fibrella sp. TaxID=1284596 RepID=UPI0035CB01F6